MKRIYFDNAATTPIHPKVKEKMLPYLNEYFGNPSSIHSFGREIRVAIEESREFIADFINADPSEIYFTSGGTEADNAAIFGIAKTELEDSGKNKILTSKAEHHAILESYEKLAETGFNAKFIGNDADSRIRINELNSELDNNTSLVSFLHVNNETGACNKIEEIVKSAKSVNSLVHIDCVQSFGKFELDVKKLGVDTIAGSAHKIYGPKGIGFLYGKSGTPLSPIIHGGSQERNRRGGTENIIGIIGLTEAVRLAKENMADNFNAVSKIRERFIEGLKSITDNTIIINTGTDFSPFIVSVTFKSEYYNNDPEGMIMYLDINGIAVSNGSACTSGTLKPSHVILSMGKSSEDAAGTLRFSFSPFNTYEEVDYSMEVLKKFISNFRK